MANKGQRASNIKHSLTQLLKLPLLDKATRPFAQLLSHFCGWFVLNGKAEIQFRRVGKKQIHLSSNHSA